MRARRATAFMDARSSDSLGPRCSARSSASIPAETLCNSQPISKIAPVSASCKVSCASSLPAQIDLVICRLHRSTLPIRQEVISRNKQRHPNALQWYRQMNLASGPTYESAGERLRRVLRARLAPWGPLAYLMYRLTARLNSVSNPCDFPINNEA